MARESNRQGHTLLTEVHRVQPPRPPWNADTFSGILLLLESYRRTRADTSYQVKQKRLSKLTDVSSLEKLIATRADIPRPECTKHVNATMGNHDK